MATEPSVEIAPAGLAEAIEQRYELPRLAIVRRLAGGYANDVYLAETGPRRLVVRVLQPPVDLRALEWEHAVVSRLADSFPAAIAPRRARDGATYVVHDGAAVVVLPHVAGAPASRGDGLAAAALLGRFHRAAADLDVRQRPGATPLTALQDGLESGRYLAGVGPRARDLAPELDQRRDEIDAGYGWLLEWIEHVGRERAPAAGVVHGDVFGGNVLVRAGRAVALLDWEEARIDWLAADLANGVWEFCRDDATRTLDRSAADAFVAAYRAAGGVVPPAEDDLLRPLIRVRRLLEVLRACHDRHVDWDYQLRNLDSFAALA